MALYYIGRESMVRTSLALAQYDLSKLKGKVLGVEEIEEEFYGTVEQLAEEYFWGDNLPTTDALQVTLLICMGLIC